MVLQAFLDSSKTSSHEVKALWSSRSKALSDRLAYFHPELESVGNNWNINEVRHWGLKAAISFIRQTPYLQHTPASLRALFSVPTRSHRKKGKYSSTNLRQRAKELGYCPDWSILEGLSHSIDKISSRNPAIAELLLKRIDTIRKRPIDFSIPEWEPGHSAKSLERLEKLLINTFRGVSVSQNEKPVESELTPDLILQSEQGIIFVELKEWESNFQLFFKPGLQVFRYALSADAVIFVLVGNPPTIFDDLQGTWTGSELLGKVKNSIDDAKSRKIVNENYRKEIFDFLKSLRSDSLAIPEICTLITIAEEILGEELGISVMEYSSARKLQALLGEISSAQVTIRNCRLNPCDGLNLEEIIRKGRINIFLIKGFH
ncbi:MAG: hypothetical protein ACXADX_05215 [Candidatus Hodarchaeales archaeon]|jgi:hypothetical protein